MQRLSFRAPDGVHLSALCSDTLLGSGDRPTILFVHGLGANVGHFVATIEALAPAFRCVALDLRGHGRSGWARPETYTTESLVGDIVAVVQQLGCDAALVGHSWGAEAVVHAALRLPKVVHGVVALDLNPDTPPDVIDGIRQVLLSIPRVYKTFADVIVTLRALFPMAPSAVVETIAAHSVSPLEAGGQELLLDPSLIQAIPRFWGAAERSRRAAATWCALRAIRVPVLLVRGSLSAILPEDTALQILAANCLIEHVTVWAGHGVAVDNARAVASHIAAFVRRSLGLATAPRPAESPPDPILSPARSRA